VRIFPAKPVMENSHENRRKRGWQNGNGITFDGRGKIGISSIFY
jgi:hypothetical protein